jgi:acetate kinase
MSALPETILAVNAGSSSLKFALYPRNGNEVEAASITGLVEGLEPNGQPTIKISNGGQTTSEALATTRSASARNPFEHALAALRETLNRHAGETRITAIAHRIVHGGARYSESILLDPEAIAYLETLSSLAPLHQPNNLAGVYAFRRAYPDLPQVGCFDTAFHATQPEVEQMFALPKALRAEGIRRYGFHGLSYRYVADHLLELSPRASGRMLIAHLGNGASVCAVASGKSIGTTMGFSALDGLMMGTRSGAVDPGVLLHLLQHGMSAKQIENMLYRESGLRGVSGISADMRTLHASKDPDAAMAINLFIHRLVRESGALTACLGGLDVLAFTGGIGEHDAELRQRTCQALAFLGIRLDPAANQAAIGERILPIHAADSSVEVWVVPTDEGRVAAGDAARLSSQAAG